jgi:hypothetical protein
MAKSVRSGAHNEETRLQLATVNFSSLDPTGSLSRSNPPSVQSPDGRRQAQGQAKAKAEGRYKGRPEDAGRNDWIARMLDAGQSWGSIQRATGCSRATIAKIAKRVKQAA